MEFAITLDIDWAPDFVIDAVADRLRRSGTRATWLVTHASPAIERLRGETELFELGLHPNFQSGSSHGDTPEAVLGHCLALVPDAKCLRTHGLVQSTALLEIIMQRTPIEIDLSLYCDRLAHLSPFSYWWKGKRLCRAPFFWEDDVEMERPDPLWSPDALLKNPGLKIFNFHPVHVYLNGASPEPYRTAKARAGDLREALPQHFDPLVGTEEGAGAMMDRLIAGAARGFRSQKISDLVSNMAVEGA